MIRSGIIVRGKEGKEEKERVLRKVRMQAAIAAAMAGSGPVQLSLSLSLPLSALALFACCDGGVPQSKLDLNLHI